MTLSDADARSTPVLDFLLELARNPMSQGASGKDVADAARASGLSDAQIVLLQESDRNGIRDAIVAEIPDSIVDIAASSTIDVTVTIHVTTLWVVE